MLPPTQQRPAESQMSEAALKARQLPSSSLFNRLDGLAHQLSAMRDFFADWPQQMCHRIRAKGAAAAAAARLMGQEASLAANTPKRTNSSNAGECWNGRDFSGYTKPVASFGFPLSAGHPEVPVARAQPISPMILNLVARLKDIGTQLARKSNYSPAISLELADKLASGASTKGGGGGGGGDPQAEARVSSNQPEPEQERILTAAAALGLAAAQGLGELDGDEQALSSVLASSQVRNQLAPVDSGASSATSAPTSNGAAALNTPGATADDLEAPDGEAAESEGDEHDDSAPDNSNEDEDAALAAVSGMDANEDELDDDEAPSCQRPDCSDLLTESTFGPLDSTNQLAAGSNNNVQHHGLGSGADLEAESGQANSHHHANNNNNHHHHHNRQHHQNSNSNNNHQQQQQDSSTQQNGLDPRYPVLTAANAETGGQNADVAPDAQYPSAYDPAGNFNSLDVMSPADFYQRSASSSSSSAGQQRQQIEMRWLQILLLALPPVFLVFFFVRAYQMIRLRPT